MNSFQYDVQTKAGLAADRYATSRGHALTAQERIDYIDGYMQASLEQRADVLQCSESYAAPALTDDASEGNRLYLDEAAWAARMVSLHGKPIENDGCGEPSEPAAEPTSVKK
jgi:hypothetical protein